MTSDITRLANGAAAVLSYADGHDVPSPTRVTVDEQIVIAVDTLHDLTVWAMLLEETIASHRDTGDHRLMRHEVRGELLEVPFVAWTHSSYDIPAGSIEEAFEDLAEAKR